MVPVESLTGEQHGEPTDIETGDAHAASLYDTAFLGVTRSILHQLHVTPKMVNTSAAAIAMIQASEFDVIVVDWREIESLPEFFSTVRRSKLNQDSVLVAIVRDLLDLRQVPPASTS